LRLRSSSGLDHPIDSDGFNRLGEELADCGGPVMRSGRCEVGEIGGAVVGVLDYVLGV